MLSNEHQVANTNEHCFNTIHRIISLFWAKR